MPRDLELRISNGTDVKKNHARTARGKRRRVIVCGHTVAELRSSMLRQPSCLSKRFYGGKGEAKALASEKKVGSWDQRSAHSLPVRSPRPTLSDVPLTKHERAGAIVRRPYKAREPSCRSTTSLL